VAGGAGGSVADIPMSAVRMAFPVTGCQTAVMRHLALALVALAAVAPAAEGFRLPKPKPLANGEVAVTGPGIYAQAGTTYVLTQDLSVPASGILLGKDTVLDLNGHTLTFAAAPYQPIPNGSFEDGLTGWDTAKAPGAEVVDRRWLHPIDGTRVCILPQGEELVSPFIDLPVADRPYYAMVAVAKESTAVDVVVEDGDGNPVRCEYRFGNQVRQTCPELGRSPKLGGGTVFALIYGQPAGRYRLRITAAKGTCVIDDADIRPALDYGVGVVGDIQPWAYYKCVLDGDDCVFFDLDRNAYPDRAATAPRIQGSGQVTIRNGRIRSGTRGIRTWGILHTAKSCPITIDNVEVVSSGTNSLAMRIACGTITRCRTDLDWSWIIDRHRQGDYGIFITGGDVPSTVADCELIGGQGQLSIRGEGSVVERNLLVNRQNVVNHYSLGLGSGITVRHNRILPEQGSGILIGRCTGIDIHDNEIAVAASPPVNEYATTDYSVSAIRLTDYNAKAGDPKGGCSGNRIRDNRITVTGRRFVEADPGYRPYAFGIFMSVGGGPNEISGNTFTVDQRDPPNSEKHGAYAIFIGGSDQGGIYHHNRIVANTTPVWMGTYYGVARNVLFHDNAIVAAKGSEPFVPFKLGWYKSPTEDIGFYSNTFTGLDFAVGIEDYTTGYVSQYTVGWTLRVTAKPGAEIQVEDAAGTAVAKGTADGEGRWSQRLPERHERGDGRDGNRQRLVTRDVSAYSVRVGETVKEISLTKDLDLRF